MKWRVKGVKTTYSGWRWKVYRADGEPVAVLSTWHRAMLFANTRGKMWK